MGITVFGLLSLMESGKTGKELKGRPVGMDYKRIVYSPDAKLSPEIDRWFKKLYSSSRFNGNLLVAKNGKIIYSNHYGYSNYDEKDTLSIDSRFQTGSVSKIFTAAAILLLKERGQLAYSDQVEKFIPHFPYKGITISQLLSHRSGLPNYNYFCDAYTDRETIIYNKDVVRLMIDSIPAGYYQPDERFDYCNTNFVLLAYIIEQVSGLPFEDFMRNEIFRKAGMRNTSIFMNGKQTRIPHITTGYHFPWTVALPTYQDGVTGDKGVYTTVEDLWLFNEALDNNQILKKETLEEAYVPASQEKRGQHNYGYGWRLRTAIDGSKFVFHTGWWRGFNALFVKDIKNNAVFVLLCNVRTRALYAMFPELLGIIDPQRYQLQVASDSLYKDRLDQIKDTTRVDIEM